MCAELEANIGSCTAAAACERILLEQYFGSGAVSNQKEASEILLRSSVGLRNCDIGGLNGATVFNYATLQKQFTFVTLTLALHHDQSLS